MAFRGGKKWYTAFLWWVCARLCGHTQTRFAGDLEGLDQTFRFTLSLMREGLCKKAARGFLTEAQECGGGKGEWSE